MLWQEIRGLDTGWRALRSFGLVVGAVLVGIAAVVLWRRGWEPDAAVRWLGGAGAALVLLGALAPGVLKPVYRVWMGLALVLGFVTTHVILAVLYYFVFTPIGLVMRLAGKNPMHPRPDPGAATYWTPKAHAGTPRERMEKYY